MPSLNLSHEVQLMFFHTGNTKNAFCDLHLRTLTTASSFITRSSPPIRRFCTCWMIAFRMSRRRREVYSGHGRLWVCLCVCPSPHAHTTARPGCNLGNGRGCPLVVHYCVGRFAIGARVSLLWQHSAEREMSASACTRSMSVLRAVGHGCDGV